KATRALRRGQVGETQLRETRQMSLTRFISSVLAIGEMEARKIRHDSTELWMRSVQPALWLLIFGEVLNSVKVLAPAGYSYIQYIAPGVGAQSVLFVAIFYGIAIVWERDVGLLTKLLSTPSRRPWSGVCCSELEQRDGSGGPGVS